MRAALEHKGPAVRTEQIILFRASSEIFAISSGSVQEVRSVDSLAGSPVSVSEPSLSKVRHAIRRGDKNVYVVNDPAGFLTAEDLFSLDAATGSGNLTGASDSAGAELSI